MATKKPGAIVAKQSTNVALPERTTATRVEYERITNGDWVGARLIDAQDGLTSKGDPCVNYQFEVTSPRIYAGTKLYYTMHAGLALSLDTSNPASLASAFPGVDLMDADSAWNGIGRTPLRVHVGHRQTTDVETGEVSLAYRVTGFRIDERARA